MKTQWSVYPEGGGTIVRFADYFSALYFARRESVRTMKVHYVVEAMA